MLPPSAGVLGSGHHAIVDTPTYRRPSAIQSQLQLRLREWTAWFRRAPALALTPRPTRPTLRQPVPPAALARHGILEREVKMFSLEGKTCVVTGASRGLGRAIAMAFAEQGGDVVLAARSVADLEQARG